MLILKGIGGSKGYAGGTAVVKKGDALVVPKREVSDVDGEFERFRAARETYDARLKELAEHTAAEIDAGSAEIFDAYRVILHDDVFFNKILDRVSNEKLNIEHLIEEEYKNVSKMFESFDDPYLRDRAVDIENVCVEVIRIMMGISSGFFDDISHYDDVILVSDDLTPAETVKIDKSRLRGFITVKGGITSHTVILAKALGIPAIVGAEGALENIETGDALLMDGVKGEIIIDPDEKQRETFNSVRGHELERKKLFDSAVSGPCETLDNFHVDVNINSGDAESIAAFSSDSCDGVGLFRTEFLYMEGSDYPSEQRQYVIYSDLAKRAEGKEVIIRTLDIGGDKRISYMDLPVEDNPFLGYRAIRLCLDRRDVFLTQLRAILRAAVHGNIKIMFPMIVTLEELKTARSLVEEAAGMLREQGIPYRGDLPVGIMVETPAAVMLSDRLAESCDFFSIGSNDLIQYTTATDRMNQNVQYLYESCNISVLRSIRMVAENADIAGIPWGICGEVASEDTLVPLWVAMGVSELSVTPSQVGRVKYLIRRCDRGVLIPEMEAVLECGSIDEAKARLGGILAKIDE